ncbi:protein phosphatase 2C domain-containing protein [Caballeronia sp. LZ029]|uniref:protein phosphatase 2C domain-containing protein n=1 Tax=Caballeronia sp. LZ029 TaxID=3038564 RepID=UPI003857CDE6
MALCSRAAPGTSHLRQGTRKHDAVKVSLTVHDSLCAVVSDGTGSASHERRRRFAGFSRLIQPLSRVVREKRPPAERRPSHVQGRRLRDRLGRAASNRNIEGRQFAATFVVLAIRGDKALCRQIGDGAVVARRDSERETLSAPVSGELASTTFFVADKPQVRRGPVERTRDTTLSRCFPTASSRWRWSSRRWRPRLASLSRCCG